MKSKVPFDHPFRSDKDGLIYDLRSQIDKLARENVRLERINRGERRRRLRKFCVWTVLAILAVTTSFGIAYAAYAAFKDDVALGRKCTELCRHVMGHIVISGDETTYNGCGDSRRHCICRIASGIEITLGNVSRKELNSDLKEVARRFDFASWRKCVNLGSKVPDITCGRVPRTDRDKQ